MAKGKRITGAARDQLTADVVKEYDGGATIRAIAEKHHRSYGLVHRLLTEGKVTLRGRGGPIRRAAA